MPRVDSPDTAEHGTGSLARNRDFLILWTGGAVSELGTSMSQLVFPLVGYAITHSTAEAGLATTALVLGQVVLRLPAGALVDRMARSRVLVASNLVAAAVYFSLAIAVLADRLTLAHLVIAGFLSGATEAFAAPATSATVRTIVPTRQLPLAYTRLEVRRRTAQLIGPPLGGALYSLARAVPFVFDAASYAIESFAITRLRTPLPAPKLRRQSMRADVLDGLRFVWVNVGVRCMMIWGGLINLAGSFVFVAITLRLIQGGTRPAVIGLVETAAAVAGLVGAFAAPALLRRAPTGWLTITFTLLMAALVVPQAWAMNAVAVGALLAAGTFLLPASNAGISAYMVSVVPDELQGRVNSAAGFVSTALAPVGPVLAGVALAVFGGVTTLVVGAAATAMTTLPLLASRTVRELGPPDRWPHVDQP